MSAQVVLQSVLIIQFVATQLVTMLVTVNQDLRKLATFAKVKYFIFYRFRFFNILCITDVDECSTNTDNCSPNAICTNTFGSFSCVCVAGYDGNGVNCEGKFVKIIATIHFCLSCFLDINECTSATDDCSDNALCVNEIGYFNCTCFSGYEGNGKTCNGLFCIFIISTVFNYFIL